MDEGDSIDIIEMWALHIFQILQASSFEEKWQNVKVCCKI